MEEKRYSHYIPLWKITILSLVTFGLYQIYWMYHNWVILREEKLLDIRPILRTIGLFLPVLGFYIAYTNFRDIFKLIREKILSTDFTPGLMVFVWGFFNTLSIIPKPNNLWTYLSVIPILVVQKDFNTYWKKCYPDLVIKKFFSRKEIIIILIGTLFSIPYVLVSLGLL